MPGLFVVDRRARLTNQGSAAGALCQSAGTLL